MPVFTDMLRSVLGKRLAPAANFPEMLADDVDVEHPYAPSGGRRISGRSAVAAHLETTKAAFSIDYPNARHVFECEGDKVVIVEFDLAGRWLQSGNGYEQMCVAIIETNAGRITRYREYWNPLAVGMPRDT